jgi:glycosyltransferase involved in cell wall biosynthesis
VRFSVITPSFRSSDWLKLCIASVADQSVEVEHIVQDSCSDDGTQDWLPGDARVKAVIEKDRGMSDAINRGLRRATGEILAYLNCDEQYQPGALKSVDDFFTRNPHVDLVFGDVVMVDGSGNYLSHRKMQTPLLHHTWTCHLSTLSCGMFFRRKLAESPGPLFDPAFRDVGDGELMVRWLRQGVPMGTLGQFTSVFAITGANMSAGANAQRENRQLFQSAPGWARRLRPLLIAHHRLRRMVGGMYFQKPFKYEIFTSDSRDRRKSFAVNNPKAHSL